MSEVYVLTRSYDYEGESPIGVYATLAGAKARASEIATEQGWIIRQEWGDFPSSWRMSNGSSDFVIRLEEVRDA